MASASDFKKLSTFEGVVGYLLVREDNHIVVHNTEDPEKLSSAIIACVKDCREIEDFLDTGQFSRLCVERKEGNNLLIFSLGKYFLGIIKTDDVNPSTMVDSIISYLKTLSKF